MRKAVRTMKVIVNEQRKPFGEWITVPAVQLAVIAVWRSRIQQMPLHAKSSSPRRVCSGWGD